MGAKPGPQSVSLAGEVIRTIFSNPRNGWSVLSLRTDDGLRVTVTGTLPGVCPGDRIEVTGKWVEHPRFGLQLEAQSFILVGPDTAKGMLRFLASGRVKGIGKELAERIVSRFGTDTIRVLNQEPEKLLEVRGIGPGKLEEIKKSWAAVASVGPLMSFLQSFDVPSHVAWKLVQRYGELAIERVRTDPYQIASEVRGIGFLTADRIASAIGIPKDSTSRIMAGLLHVLSESAASEGHVYLPRGELEERASKLLDLELGKVSLQVDEARAQGKMVLETVEDGQLEAAYLPRLFASEKSVASSLLKLSEQNVDPLSPRAADYLSDEQAQAFRTISLSPVSIVTGGPGTGKTTLIRSVAEAAASEGINLMLVAPTGRAAKRLAEATGCQASTIHRALEYNPAAGGFLRNPTRPLEASMVVVDEASMLDLELAASLLSALKRGTRVVLVGDVDQLPPVGPGQVLSDLISSGRFPVSRLTSVFRQAEGTTIVRNAHRINSGKMPIFSTTPEGDFFFVEKKDPKAAAEMVVRLVAERIPKRFGLDPIRDVQVLAPMHKGELGVANLNLLLQNRLNKEGEPTGLLRLRIGDKVMQVRNNYDLGVFNGDMGTVAAYDKTSGELVVEFEDRQVVYPPSSADELVLAYACTVHKAQGSEYEAVVIAVHEQHWIMLARNLLYTAVTRAKRLVAMVGTWRALARCVTHKRVEKRYSALSWRLKNDPHAACNSRNGVFHTPNTTTPAPQPSSMDPPDGEG